MFELEKLQDLLNNHNIEAAQQFIQSYEERLDEEKNKYSQKILKEKINKLKQAFNNASLHTNIEIEKNKLSIQNNQHSSDNVIEHKNNCSLQIENTSQLVFRECHNINVVGECETAFIRDCCDSTFELNVGQLRLYGCKGVRLKVYTKSGIYMEECNSIIIEALNKNVDNMYCEVYDFSAPFETINYKIM